ncbi:hypothetical protein [Amycolatopsis taiwanensis]|uniref:Uncharacterized protein n=1 Tax=Amycolatopsis taiwanensis TaxID=342230 RepID=A0A9W6R2S8_9PSEU|nr:hypothetical protein [Amycolatopsis taiwanensis]GLY66537.1 hypothetical protein Atai01_31560 [Amycolatopsis taiwanensis]
MTVNAQPPHRPQVKAAAHISARSSIIQPYFSLPRPARHPWRPSSLHLRFAESYAGAGNDVVVTDWPARPGIVTFECRVPGGNVAVETDGNEPVLVNAIGSYRGSRWINIHEDTRTRAFLITAAGPWRLTITDLDALPPSGSEASGAGDAVVYLSEEITEATITHEGHGNVIVEVATAADEPVDLVVNEIGVYHGTVPLAGPALVQVTSAGRWSIDGR